MSDFATTVQPALAVGQTVRPILIDSQDGPCEICAAHQPSVCDQCGGPYNPHLPAEMRAAGYQSPRPTHYHLVMILGTPGRKSHYAELCRSCYIGEWTRVYPNEGPCPIIL